MNIYRSALSISIVLLMISTGCSTPNTGEITKSLADKLSDALNFAGGTEVINQTKPTEHAGDGNYPQVTGLEMPSELPIGDFTVAITFTYGGNISDIAGAIVYIDKSGNYWQVTATPFLFAKADAMKLSNLGTSTYKMILNGKFNGNIGEGFGRTFIFEVAVAKTGWQVGNYYNQNVKPVNQPAPDAGVDAGVDAGYDASVDAGQDAGFDAGADAGTDAGTDGGGKFDGGPDYCKTSQCFAVPPTGQKMCFDNSGLLYGDGGCPSISDRDAGFWGQDAMFQKLRILACDGGPCSESVAVEGEIITDSLTGLVWQRALPTTYLGCTGGTPTGSICTWQESINYCENLDYGSHQDWYLPNPIELSSIVDKQKYNPSIDMTKFPGTPPNDFWSSSSYTDSTGFAWNVYFNDGYVSFYEKFLYYYARCVRFGGPGETAGAEERFIESEPVKDEKIITDIITGLVWEKSYGTDKNWQSALSYCAIRNYAGFQDWRLPNANELLSLVNYSKYSSASDFPDMPLEYFWSSSSYAGSFGNAWGVHFDNGGVDVYGKANDLSARCVRSGP